MNCSSDQATAAPKGPSADISTREQDMRAVSPQVSATLRPLMCRAEQPREALESSAEANSQASAQNQSKTPPITLCTTPHLEIHSCDCLEAARERSCCAVVYNLQGPARHSARNSNRPRTQIQLLCNLASPAPSVIANRSHSLRTPTIARYHQQRWTRRCWKTLQI